MADTTNLWYDSITQAKNILLDLIKIPFVYINMIPNYIIYIIMGLMFLGSCLLVYKIIGLLKKL
jgi:hypothetical protein